MPRAVKTRVSWASDSEFLARMNQALEKGLHTTISKPLKLEIMRTLNDLRLLLLRAESERLKREAA